MTETLLALFRMHLMQVKRMVGELGIFRFLFLAVVLVLLLVAFFKSLSAEENQDLLTGAFIFFLALLHLQRNDRDFIRLHFDSPVRIFTAQYFLLSLPVFIFLIYNSNWLILLMLAGGVMLIPNLNFRIKHRFNNAVGVGWIPAACFEWKAGLRKTLPLVVLSLAGGLGFSLFTGAVPLALFVLGVIPIRFFETGEPVQMLIAQEQPATKLILAKFKHHFFMFILISLPLILAFLLFHSGLWYIVLAEYVLFLSLHFYSITLKYAFYVPNEKPAAVEVFTSFGAIAIVIPVFLPIVWALTIRMFFRAGKNLKPYLDDYN